MKSKERSGKGKGKERKGTRLRRKKRKSIYDSALHAITEEESGTVMKMTGRKSFFPPFLLPRHPHPHPRAWRKGVSVLSKQHMQAHRTGTSVTLQDSQQQAGDDERKHHRNVFNNGQQRARARSVHEEEDHRHLLLSEEEGKKKIAALALDKGNHPLLVNQSRI